MKTNFIKTLLILCFFTNISYAFDTLRGAGSSQEIIKEEKTLLDKTKHWYKSLIGKTQDKPTTMQSDDIIIINSDRSITFNGKTVMLGSHINEWIKVIGDDYRDGEHNNNYIWDDLGVNVTIKSDKDDDKEAKISNSFTIQLITYNEMFPMDEKYNIPRKEMGGVKEFYFKGLVKIEDGYLSRETSFKEFRKSEIGRTKFENTFSRPSTYSMGYENKEKLYSQVIYIDLTHKGFIKRISISARFTKEELLKAKKKLAK